MNCITQKTMSEDIFKRAVSALKTIPQTSSSLRWRINATITMFWVPISKHCCWTHSDKLWEISTIISATPIPSKLDFSSGCSENVISNLQTTKLKTLVSFNSHCRFLKTGPGKIPVLRLAYLLLHKLSVVLITHTFTSRVLILRALNHVTSKTLWKIIPKPEPCRKLPSSIYSSSTNAHCQFFFFTYPNIMIHIGEKMVHCK